MQPKNFFNFWAAYPFWSVFLDKYYNSIFLFLTLFNINTEFFSVFRGG